MTRGASLSAACASAVLALAAAGCGLGGDKERSALSRSQYLERGDALCRDGLRRLERLEEKGAISPGRIDSELRHTLSRLRQLEPPNELRAETYRFNAALERQLNVARDLPQATKGARAPRADQLYELTDYALESERAASESDRLARAVGFRVCGSR